MSLITLVISLFVLLFAITIHEAAHGWVPRVRGIAGQHRVDVQCTRRVGGDDEPGEVVRQLD